MTDDPSSPSLGAGAWTWCREPAMAPAIARFFADQAGAAYISHSELQSGRAASAGRWSGDLAARIEGEAERAIAGAGTGGPRCALARSPQGLAGLAFVRFVTEAERPFAVLEDLLVDEALRGRGLGRGFMGWLRAECLAEGCSRLFLESGLANHGAHHFFATNGFAQTSIVMMRDLGAP